jgi:hypothetical protein
MLKGTVPRDFPTSGFFHESASPKLLCVSLGCFKLFQKFAEKTFNQESFKYFVWIPLGSTVNIQNKQIFSFKFTLWCK